MRGQQLFGKLVVVNEFGYNDASAFATNNPRYRFQTQIEKSAKVIVTEQFYDYECGERYIGIIQNKEDFPQLTFNNDVVYFDEHDVEDFSVVEKEVADKAIENYRTYLIEKNKAFDEKEKEIYGRNLWEEKLATLGANILEQMIEKAVK